MQDFRKLRVWQKADQLAVDVVAALPQWRCRRVPGLRAQAIRAAGSIPDLIAEGCGRSEPRELSRYVEMALASAAELRSQLARAHRTGILARESYERLDAAIDEIRRMLVGLKGRSVASTASSTQKPTRTTAH